MLLSFLFIPLALVCLIILAFAIQRVLRLQALQVALQRSRIAKTVLTPRDLMRLVARPLRAYGVRTAGDTKLAFQCAVIWLVVLTPGIAFLRWDPAAFFGPTPWLRSDSVLGRAERLRAAHFATPLDALEVLVAPKDPELSVLSFTYLDALVNVHNAVTGTEVHTRLLPSQPPVLLRLAHRLHQLLLLRLHQLHRHLRCLRQVQLYGRSWRYEDICERRALGTRVSCEFDSALRLALTVAVGPVQGPRPRLPPLTV